MPDAAAATLVEFRRRFAQYRLLAERALAQVSDEAFFAPVGPLDPLAVVVKHVAGNVRSRWTDFLASDGEKPDRHRDTEFALYPGDTRAALMARWADAWQTLAETLDGLAPENLTDAVTIRAEQHGVVEALGRGLSHAAYHVGQIVLLAKYHAGADWQTLSIARGQSEAYTAALRTQHELR